MQADLVTCDGGTVALIVADWRLGSKVSGLRLDGEGTLHATVGGRDRRVGPVDAVSLAFLSAVRTVLVGWVGPNGQPAADEVPLALAS